MIHLMMGCSGKQEYMFQTDPDAQALSQQAFSLPDCRFLVFSDPHYYARELGTSGPAFQRYLDRDRKLLALSHEIIGTAVEGMAAEDADFVLVCGDMTKDGEMVCHRGMVHHLRTLAASGKKIFVVPGNHDLRNWEAVRFVGDETQAVAHATPQDFEKFYHDFGYGQGVARDPDSLSYVAEPVEGLWILALDSCRWKENQPGHHPITGGAFSPGTLKWMESQLLAAKQGGKAVMAFFHHGVMEHYPANKKFYGEYLVENDGAASALLAAYGVSLVFTGHFHSQDVTAKKLGGHTLFDIETGSLATAPCPWRRVDIENKSGKSLARIQSRFVRSIPSMGEAFAAHADAYVFEGTKKLAETALKKYKVGPEQRELIKHQIAKAYMAHLKGDEIRPEKILDREGFNLWLKIIAWLQEDLIEGWQTDLSPRDNDLTICLDTGEVV